MSEDVRELVGAVRTYLQVHGRGRHFATGSWVDVSAVAGDGPVHAPETTPVAEAVPDPEFGREDFGSGTESVAPTRIEAGDLDQLREVWGQCTRCSLAGGRTNLVFGEGAAPADLMFIGEGPGEQEDLQGRPFVGRAGELLTKMIEAMGLSRDLVFIANIVKCRPPGNRDPEPGEVTACLPVLLAQIRLVRPRVIVSLGRISAQTLLSSGTPISRLRGRWHRFEGVDLMPTFHPAYLLRSPEKKKEAWQDLQLVMEKLREPHA
ncbi:MAG: DNA polymerase [Deltaproteobacteria bacterium HGW-Deltaproteobacteria-22]|jgi:DNA polymerase|nr:MAG: DNA polymerase [Deltaproteobacteria bacterium HGW-Deltaproteobacteria-22]